MPPSSGDLSGAPDPDQVRCPTCRAIQEWSDTCRRCKSDLRLLRKLTEAYWQIHRACLARLRSGRPRAALRLAQHCRSLSASAESDRLLAVCALLNQDWPSAADWGRRLSNANLQGEETG